MKVLSISYDDHSNFMFNNCQALQSVGISAFSVKRVKHAFGYKEESKVVSTREIERLIQKYDIIQLFHSDATWLDYAFNLGKRVVVYHTGTAYRMNPDHVNSLFNDKVERSFTDQCEFIGLGMKNETYIATAIDTDKIKAPILSQFPIPLFAHYPSNPGTKGTDKIREMLEYVFEGDSTGDECFDIQIDKLPHEQQLERMRNCFCYIELFAPTQNSRPYGCFGVTAFEAAALGRMVITNNIRPDVYERVYGPCKLIIANTEREFISTIMNIMDEDPVDLYGKMQRTRDWVVRNHSFQATGMYLKKCLNL